MFRAKDFWSLAVPNQQLELAEEIRRQETSLFWKKSMTKLDILAELLSEFLIGWTIVYWLFISLNENWINDPNNFFFAEKKFFD